jgi:hypothetical protein
MYAQLGSQPLRIDEKFPELFIYSSLKCTKKRVQRLICPIVKIDTRQNSVKMDYCGMYQNDHRQTTAVNCQVGRVVLPYFDTFNLLFTFHIL